MKFVNMSGRQRVVYDSMWGNIIFFGGTVDPTSTKGTTTYKFRGADACSAIKSLYNVSNPQCFERKYLQATSGQGNEGEKILTLHSSSRCALLAFYNIEEHPVRIEINNKSIEFNYSAFEFKNPAIGYPSNMDIVLLSTDRKVVLFLESKFAEYYLYAGKTSNDISTQYQTNKFSKEFYKEEWLNQIGLESVSSKEKYFEISVKSGLSNPILEENYFDGYKQMVSHYVGIRRRIQGDGIAYDKAAATKDIAKEVLDVVKDPESMIYLGEILFDKFYLPDGCRNASDPVAALKRYSDLYTRLARKMNQVNQMTDDYNVKNRFIILENDLKYSEYMSMNKDAIDDIVLEFYGM